MHKPIIFEKAGLFFDKPLFADFTTQLFPGQKVALIGANGTGKSSLLNLIYQKGAPSEGKIIVPNRINMGYIPQLIEAEAGQSGGERFLKSLSKVMAQAPNLLLLDEPTNHLDQENRYALLKMMKRFSGTLIVISHDQTLLRNVFDIIWNVEDQKIRIFNGGYDDFLYQQNIEEKKREKDWLKLKKKEKEVRENFDFEEKRKVNKKHKREKDRALKAKRKETGQVSKGKRNKKILEEQRAIKKELKTYKKTAVLEPNFELEGKYMSSAKVLLSIKNGSVRYKACPVILPKINLTIHGKERLWITGKNGVGKSSLVKAVLNDPAIVRTGDWESISFEHIGYLDQHYKNLNCDKTVIENIRNWVPYLEERKIREILSTFLFRKNEEVNILVKNLSGGEKARLSLAQIAVKTPALLILDEVTNNIDLPTKKQMIKVLQKYPGAMMIISHEEAFIEQVGSFEKYEITKSLPPV